VEGMEGERGKGRYILANTRRVCLYSMARIHEEFVLTGSHLPFSEWFDYATK
jgi:hypothetical protein